MAATALALVPVLVLAVVGGGGSAAVASSGAAVAGVPGVAVAAYRAASAAAESGWGCVVPVSLVAAIGAVESGHATAGGSRIDEATGDVDPPIYGPRLDGSGAGGNTTPVHDSDGGELDGDSAYDRAVGPLQFLPATWRGVERQLGKADSQNMFDATVFAAWYLCAGRPVDLTDEDARDRAVLRYNRSQSYLDAVRTEQARLRPVLDGRWGYGDPATLLAHPRFSTSAHARADLEAGIVDPRLVGLLMAIVDDLEREIYVSPFKTGHSRCVGGGDRPGCSESHHYHARAADISVVDGVAVTRANTAARSVTDWLASIAHVDELSIGVGSPWGDYQEPGFFTDASHQGHIHLSVCGPRRSNGTTRNDCR